MAVTVSAGVATLPANASDGLALVGAADEALYESKRSGRDRYTVSSRRAHPRAPSGRSPADSARPENLGPAGDRPAWQAGPVPSLFDDLSWRGLVHQLTDPESLPRRLDAAGLVVYIGFDPTADSLHVGHLQQICLLRRFQEAGHRPIALVGGGTGMIGDPSGKSEERNLLDPRASSRPTGRASPPSCPLPRLRPATAPSWPTTPTGWARRRLLDFLRDVGKLFSVNEMIRKESVRARLDGREQSLSFTEFSYMLLQAWDFVQLFDRYGCELQLGGSDQWGNITEGVDLIRRLPGRPGLRADLAPGHQGRRVQVRQDRGGNVWLDPAGPARTPSSSSGCAPSTPTWAPYLRRLHLPPAGANRGTGRGDRRPPRAAGGATGAGVSS